MRRDPAFDAPWMHQPPPRPAPAQRAAARAERAQRASRRPPLPDDTVDPLDVAERRPAWQIYDLDNDRRHRCTALHCTIPLFFFFFFFLLQGRSCLQEQRKATTQA